MICIKCLYKPHCFAHQRAGSADRLGPIPGRCARKGDLPGRNGLEFFPALCYTVRSKVSQKWVSFVAMENGIWILHGMDWDCPQCIRSWQALVRWIDEIGFLPLFQSGIEGFSVEEHTSCLHWWSGDPERDPWEWRQLIARSGRVAYGKFFGRKAGFIAKDWFPHFANWRRDGYDFDSRWDDARASRRQKRIMDQFADRQELSSFALRRLAGFGKGGETNFDGTVTDLQMDGYLLIRDFRQRVNKRASPMDGPSRSTVPRKPSGAMNTSLPPIPQIRPSPET